MLAVLFLGSFIAATTEAKEACPWLNDQTAAGFLGGEVTSTVTFAIKDKNNPNYSNVDKNDAICEFVRHQGLNVITLRLEVETMMGPPDSFANYAARCGPNGVPVRAIGNQAVACDLESKKNVMAEQLVSRVRGRAFIVRITSTVASSDTAALRKKTCDVAEQVAGFLF